MEERKLKVLREIYKPGTRVQLVSMDDPQSPPVGTCGTIVSVDDAMNIHTKWDNGSSLSLLYGVDSFSVVEKK